jgi:hypothetical protein
MWEPVGPLPAAIYWRRRCSAALVGAAVLGLLVWTAFSIAAPAWETTTRAASRVAVSAPQPTAPPPASAPTPASTPGAGTPPGAAPDQDVAATPASGSDRSGDATAERLQPDDTPRASLPAPPPIPVPATGPVPCSDDMIGVAAEIDPDEHRIGQRPTLRLVVTNVSEQPCVRDLDSARQEIVVWSGDGRDRLWSSNDCVNGSAADLRTLVPGQPVAFAVAWAGRTSVPGCAGGRTVVPAGNYRVMSRVDGVISAATNFQRLP